MTTEWLKWLTITEGFEWGATPNYYPAGGVLPYVGASTNASLGLTFRPTPRLRHELTYLYSGLKGAAQLPGRRATIFSNTIARSALSYQFTRELSVRAIVDYNAVMPNASLVRLVNDKRLGVDTLLTYQLGPGTALYIGYTTGFQNVTPSLGGLPVDRISTPSTQVGRQVFGKISYLIRR